MKFEIKKEIENTITVDFVKVIEQLQILAQKVLSGFAEQLGKTNIQPIEVVSIIIMKRCVECVNSIKILSLMGNERDVAILILNMIELRLDILYMAQDYNNADIWLKHAKEYRKPWSVSSLYKKLYKGSELEAEKDIYKRFSMVKHGNPVGGLTSFPIGVRDKHLVIRDETVEGDIIPVYLFGCGNEIYRVTKTLINISQDHNFDLAITKEELEKKKTKLEKLYNKYINNKINELKSVTVLPDLCKECNAIPKDVIEITCLLKQSNKKDDGSFECDKFKPM